jgi:hypothetical protein
MAVGVLVKSGYVMVDIKGTGPTDPSWAESSHESPDVVMCDITKAPKWGIP